MIILASQSPRRRELFGYITTDFVATSPEVDETLPGGIAPHDAVMYLSKIKALAFKDRGNTVVGADTVVSCGGEILGKPKSREDAHRMLSMLSGIEHSVFTGVTVLRGEKSKTFYVETKVKFYDLTDEEIDNYIATGEPMDKAGAYGIQGKGSLLVEEIKGDYFNVVGLPISRLHREIKEFL